MTIVNSRQLATTPKHSALKPPTRATLTEQITERLGDAIRSGALPAGTRLTETSIAHEMRTSRGPIREALRQLAQEGLVDLRPHRGAVVCLPSDAELADMVLVRAVLESAAARLICNTRENLDLSPLREIIEKMRAAAKGRRAERLSELDWQFHLKVVQLSGSAQLLKCWTMMRDGLGLIMLSGRRSYENAGGLADSHAEMLDFLQKKSPTEAERYFRNRLLDSGSRWLGRKVRTSEALS